MSAFLLRLIRILIFLSSITPLITSSNAFFGPVVDRTFFFWTITQIMTASWVILWTIDAQYVPGFKRLALTVAFLLLSLILCTVFANSLFLSFFSTFERMMGLLTYLHLFFFFLVASSVLGTKDWRILLGCLLLAGVISSTMALVLRSERNLSGRIFGLLANPSFLAAYTVSQVVIACLFLRQVAKTKHKKWTVLIVAVIPLHILVVVLTGSRSGILSLLFGFLAVLLSLSFYRKQVRYWLAGFCVLFPAAFFTLRNLGSVQGQLPGQFAYLSRIFNISLNEHTFLTRRNLWSVAWEAVREHPFLGWGFEGFSFAFLKHYNPVMYEDGLWYDNPHNLLLEWLINGGLLGLSGFVLCFVTAIMLLWSNTSFSYWTKSLLSGYLVAYLSFNLNNFDSLSTALLLFTFWAFIENRDVTPVFTLKFATPLGWQRFLVQLSAVSLLVFCFAFFVVKSYRINRELTRANNNPDLSSSTFAYKKIYENATIGKYDVLVQAGLKRNSIAPNTEKSNVENYYFTTQEMLEKGLRKFNNSGQILNQLGHLNVFVSQFPKAQYYFEEFRKIAPKRQANLMDLGIVYIESNEPQKAVSVFDSIYNFEKSYTYPLIYKAVAQAKLGEFAKARETMKLVSAKNIAENGELVYMAMNNAENRQSYLDLFSGMTEAESQMINQRTYFMWMNVAYDLKDFTQLRSAFNSYRYNFNVPEKEIMPILDSAIIGNVRPVAVTKFFERYPGR